MKLKANPDNPAHSGVPDIAQKQASGCTYFAMASSAAKYTFQPTGSQGGRHLSPYLPEYVSYWSYFVDPQQKKVHRPTGGPKEDNRTGIPFGCDDHEFTVVSQMRHQSAPQSYQPLKRQLRIYGKVVELNS